MFIAICTLLAVFLAYFFLHRRVTKDDDDDPIPEPVINKPRRSSGIFAACKHEKDVISKAIDRCFIFSGIGIEDKEALQNAFEKHTVKEGEVIIQQGDDACYFYVIQFGVVEFYVNGILVGQRTDGESFGDLALVDNSKRNASCISQSEKCTLWRLHKDSRRDIMSKNTTRSHKVVVEMLKNVPIFSNFDISVLHRIALSLKEQTFLKDAVIFKKGDVGREMFVLKNGSVIIEDIRAHGQKFANVTYGVGGSFGEHAILEDEPRTGSAVADTDCTVLCISQKTFIKHFSSVHDIRRKSKFLTLLKSIPCFANSDISNSEYEKLISRIKVITVKSDTIIYRGNNKNIYLIEDGEVTVSRESSENEDLSIQTHFGENSFLEEESLIAETLTANKETVLGVLSLDIIEIVIRNICRLKKKAGCTCAICMLDKYEHLAIDELFRHKILGIGAFGKVWLVSPTKEKKVITNRVYALKVQTKRCLLDNKMSAKVISEAGIMKSLDHPFLGNILSANQDKGAIYFLMNLIKGGELYDLIQEDGVGKSLPLENARFYSACVLIGLSHMHDRNVLFRDLKPENIMIGSDGYPVIIDFGFAKKISDGGQAFTMCGSPFYTAPEVILGTGHNESFDHWAWAILNHELLIGDVPFRRSAKACPIKLYKAIVKGKIKLSTLLDDEIKDMLKQILVNDPSDRLGSLAGGVQDIRNHSWFKGIDLDAISKKQAAAPWKPHINEKNSLDGVGSGNFTFEEHVADFDDTDFLTDEEQNLFRGLNDVFSKDWVTSNPEEEKGNVEY